MSGVRAYQRTASWKDALKECRDEAGKQFDPALVDLLLRDRARPVPPSAPRRSPADRGARPARSYRRGVSLSVNRSVPPGPTNASL